MADDLVNHIHQLAVEIRDAVAAKRQVNQIAVFNRTLVTRRDWTLNYLVEIGFENFQPERTNIELWDSGDQEEFQKSFSGESNNFKTLEAKLGNKAYLLKTFLRSTGFAAFKGLDDEELRARVDALCCQLNDRALRVKVTAYLDGLDIEASTLKVADAIVLRRPTREDIVQKDFANEDEGFSFALSRTQFRLVGEFAFDVVNPPQAQAQFHRTVEALRLFRLGAVFTNRYRMDYRHLSLLPSGATHSGAERRSRFTYGLSTSDADDLASFLGDIVPLLPDPFQQGPPKYGSWYRA